MATTFTTPHTAFVDALSDALLATSKPGNYVPILECIQLAGDKGAESVTLTGTDRFIMVQRVIPIYEPLTDKVSATLHRAEVDMLVGVLKLTAAQRRMPTGPMTVTVDDAHVTAAPHNRGGLAVPIADHGEYIRWQSLLERQQDATADIDLLAVNLGYLTTISKLSAAKSRKGVAHLRFTKGKDGQPGMIFADFGDDGSTRVIVMPARTDR